MSRKDEFCVERGERIESENSRRRHSKQKRIERNERDRRTRESANKDNPFLLREASSTCINSSNSEEEEISSDETK